MISTIRILLPPNLYYHPGTWQISAIIKNYQLDGNKLSLTIKGEENLLGSYTIKTEPEKKYYRKNLKLGMTVNVSGTVETPTIPKTKNLFNYKTYLRTKQIHHTLQIDKMKLMKNKPNLYYKIKQNLKERLSVNPYLETFLLGDKSNLSTKVKQSYQQNGISHLFAISGMHINLLATLILKALEKLKATENKKYFITSLFLTSYLLLVGFSASIVRGVLFFLLFSINKIYYFHINKVNIFLITISIALLLNPFYIYDVGCWYSFLISLGLLLFTKEETSYWKSLVTTSLISFIISIPISLYHFYQLNILSILYNLFYVPLVSIFIFPLSLLTIIFTFLTPLYQVVTILLEQTSLYLTNIKIGICIFKKVSIIFYIFYGILGVIALSGIKKNTYKKLFPLIVLLVFHYILPNIIQSDYIKMIDVGQGDSLLLFSNNKTALIDTGGKLTYQGASWTQRKNKTTLTDSTLIPLLKSLGIKKLDTIILTHGDMDHAGEIFNLLEKIKVKSIFINAGSLNTLEQHIRKKYKSTQIAEEETIIQVGNFSLYQLNKEFKEENDSSSVYYVTHPKITLLLMGDATIKSEDYIKSNYQLENIDILKVGHHGSTTSSSTSFLKQIKPKLALISAGEDNKFGHPKKEVITRLNRLKIPYLTTITSGTITILPKTGIITEDTK